MELLVSFAGGIFGAAIGALPVWILCGLAVLIGAAVNAATGDAWFTGAVAWGFFIGPHTAFAGGAAAAAYAAKQKELSSGRDILTPLIGLNNPIVLLVGGIFGAIGYILFWLIRQVPDYNDIPWTNAIALAVILNMFIARLILGKTGLFGKNAKGTNRWIASESACWLPYQSKPMQVLLVGIAVSIPSAYLADLMPGSVGITFGFVAFLLIFMQFGFKVPVTHHIALASSVLTVATGNPAWGVAFGIFSAYVGEISAGAFLCHGDTHIDPPTMALTICFTLHPLLAQLNIFDLQGNLVWGVTAAIALSGYFLLTILKKEKTKGSMVESWVG